MTTVFLLDIWPTLVIFVGGHVVAYQGILISLFYTQSQNTKAYVRRMSMAEQTTQDAWHTITTNAYLEVNKSGTEGSLPSHSVSLQRGGQASPPPRYSSRLSAKGQAYLNVVAKHSEFMTSHGLQSTRIVDGDDYLGAVWKGRVPPNMDSYIAMESLPMQASTSSASSSQTQPNRAPHE
ncbi:hypothetical protein SYNPS1DRAFT_22209 [Syncephalis pseudoplumigaleata]|uniref:Uncharacterized protein n=1 Tax=Syncephalis pseudoplumigaleata TaxID=1712513 RepID=A0A4P9Z0E1_9FUNG|nr:hypothetical protein SYNPS1DRAFT_22209 [Syncephalis pseudoplumigaleata]|eukprot:RKP25923.1 hypothetical protein SYNPS1DRAFT_22209 [Syncephalis pseudoplumigaleata]